MPEKKGPNLGLTGGYVTGENGWGGPMTESLLLIDTLLHAGVKSLAHSEPPIDAQIGDRYIVAPGATKQWLNHDREIALKHDATTWRFYKPSGPWRVRCDALNSFIWWDARAGSIDPETNEPTGAWVNESTGEPVDGGADPQAGKQYEIMVSCPYRPQSREYLFYAPLTFPVILLSAGGASLAKADSPPEIPIEVEILRNGQKIGAIRWEAEAANGAFSVSSPVTFGIGDTIALRMPAEVSQTFQIIGVSLRFTVLGE